jgi:hypothetical protein
VPMPIILSLDFMLPIVTVFRCDFICGSGLGRTWKHLGTEMYSWNEL